MRRVIKNRYQISQTIGIGGMATVYLARDIQTGTVVAVKVMDKRLLSDEKYIARFKREINIIKHLNHPNIPKLIDYGTLNDEGFEVPFIIMEYVQGITLREYIKQKGNLSIKEVSNISIQILEALSYAYRNGVQAHRDIKPSNVMINSNNNKVKVMDFGIAKTVGSNLTHSTALFTPHYASPEQLIPSKFNNRIDKRTDIYSLGIMMYEMLIGKTPYRGTTPGDILEEQFKNKPPSPSDIRRDIPFSYSQIILKCIQLDPSKRYQSPEELIEDLRKGKCSKPVPVFTKDTIRKTVKSKSSLGYEKTQVSRRDKNQNLSPYQKTERSTHNISSSSYPNNSYQHNHKFSSRKPLFITLSIALSFILITAVALGISHNYKSNKIIPCRWKRISDVLTGARVYSLAIDPTNTQTIYAGAWGDGVFKSTDGGANWIEMINGLTDIHILSLAIDPLNTQIIYIGTLYGVFKSTDGETHWTKISNGLTNTFVLSLAVDPKNTQTIYAGTNSGGVFKSTDGGAHWSEMNEGLTGARVYSLAIDPLNTQIIYIGTLDGVFNSTDGGANWTKMNNGLTNGDVKSLAIDPKNTQIIYAGTNGDGVFKYVCTSP